MSDLTMKARLLQEKRAKERKEVQDAMSKISDGTEQAIGSIASRFTVKSAAEEARTIAKLAGSLNADAANKSNGKKRSLGGDKQRKVAKQRLSFMHDEEEEDDDSSDDEDAEENVPVRAKGITKDPRIDTTFLPDKERERREQALREEKLREWELQQERMKEEDLSVAFSYWTGTGVRLKITVKKGNTIGEFLTMVQKKHSRLLHGIAPQNLMYVKEDTIIPPHVTFYDLIVTKARGRRGALYQFDVIEDVRMVTDVRVESEESHAGKVLTRKWYVANKSKHPANKWEVYDPTKQTTTNE